MSDKANFKSLEIEPLKYEGSVDDFRAWMDRFLLRAGVIRLMDAASQEEIRQKSFDDWKNSGMKGDIINAVQYYPFLMTTYAEHVQSPNREVWRVVRVDPIHDDPAKPPKKWATIMAVEVLNITTVEFSDGIYYHLLDENDRKIDYARVEFIGEDFSKYAQFIKDEWEKKHDVKVIETDITPTPPEELQSLNQGVMDFSNVFSGLLNEAMNSVKESTDLSPLFAEVLTGIRDSLRGLTSITQFSNYRKDDIYPQVLEISDGLDNVEEAVEVITPKVLGEETPEVSQVILGSKKAMMEEIERLRSKVESLETFAGLRPSDKARTETKKFPKRGRKTLTDQRKLDALRKWDAIDRSIYDISLEQFLRQEFGENPDGSPVVPNPTFHGWRSQLRSKGIEI